MSSVLSQQTLIIVPSVGDVAVVVDMSFLGPLQPFLMNLGQSLTLYLPQKGVGGRVLGTEHSNEGLGLWTFPADLLLLD